MKITFLGTGTSQGVPIIGCQCEVCQSDNPKDQRLRSSVLIEIDGLNLVIDSGPDFRQQMLREQVTQLDALLFTHDHKDHTAGLDDIRAFNHIQQKAMELYGEPYVLDTLKKEFSYAFAKNRYPGVPLLHLNKIENKVFSIKHIDITPIRGLHLKLPVLGFKIGSAAYLTDMNFLANEELLKLKDIDLLIIDALRTKKHISHFNLAEALEIIRKTNAKTAYLTHISHGLGTYNSLSPQLPSNVHMSYDGLCIEL